MNKTNQCGEVCERAKLCAVCIKEMNQKPTTNVPADVPAAYEVWVGADTPLNNPMGWQRYGIYDNKIQAETTARTINSYKQAPFAKIVELFRK